MIGQSAARSDIPAKVTGQAQFGMDVRLPGLLFAAVRMNPVLGGAAAPMDTQAALALPGVSQVVALDGRRWALAGYRAPDPTPPALAPMAVRVLNAVRSRPGTLNELRARLPDMADNTLRGRLSDLGRKGLLRRDGDRWAATP